MREREKFALEPPPLAAMDRTFAALVERANREFATSNAELEAFSRARSSLPRRLQKSPNRARALVLAFAVGLLGLVVFIAQRALLQGSEPAARNARSVARALPSARASVTERPAAPGKLFDPKRTAVALDVGRNTFADGTVVELTSGGSASVSADAQKTRVVLDRGRLDLSVEHQPAGHRLEVASLAYRFEVLGTAFSVAIEGDRLELHVREGRVGVFSGATLLEEVGAGESWTSPTTQAERAKAPGQPQPDCLALARAGQPREAERCFLSRAAGNDLAAEMALYEVARLRRDVLGDPSGALAALREHRSRFANGSLRHEVDISYVELLARLGRHQESLEESAKLLESPSGKARAFDLRMLRGKVYRNGLGSLRNAEREYAEAERVGGAAGAEASYQRGTCLEELGDSASAARAYERYLSYPKGKRAEEVRRRLSQLGR